jgi:replicative DNA helicase
MEKPTTALIENIITLLCYNDEYGKVITNMVDHQLFEGDYRVVAERAIGYWQQYGEAPGVHTSDLVSDIIDDPHNRKAGTFKRILIAMQALSDSVNTTYVMEQLRSFTRMQKLKEAILKSAEQLNSQQETAISSVEEIWNNLLRSQETTFDPGTRLTEYGKVLAYMDTQAGEFTTGIPTLDRNGIVPMRGTLGIFLAPTGFGKSWYLIHLGKQALAQRKNILHVSLEMSEEEVLQRYYQSL